jgi:hypothetical protein
VRKQALRPYGMIFSSIFGFLDLFSCCKVINFTHFRKILRKLFLHNGIIAQFFGTNAKSIYKYKTNEMCEICKSISQRENLGAFGRFLFFLR